MKTQAYTQLIKHCSVNIEAMGSNSGEAQKIFFWAKFAMLKYNCDDHISIPSDCIPTVQINMIIPTNH